MRCPRCGDEADKVVDSRLLPGGDAIRRRRACEKCNNRYTTYERIELTLPLIVKKQGQREEFNREKLRGGIVKAMHRRPIPADAVDEFLRHVENRLAAEGEREVASSLLGDLVMEFLRKQDKIAYVRFASVYREFRDISELLVEVNELARDGRARAKAK